MRAVIVAQGRVSVKTGAQRATALLHGAPNGAGWA